MHDHLPMLAKGKFNSIKTLISQALIDLFYKKYISTLVLLSNLLIFLYKKYRSTLVLLSNLLISFL